jgi:SPP1 family predicted phage head-tail adaptor
MGITKLFKDSIEIYAYTESQDALGEPIQTWTKTSTIYAFLNDAAGGVRYINDGIQSISTAKIFCANTVTLSTKMMIKCVESGKVYNILYVNIPITSLKNKKKFITADLEYNSEVTL